MMDRFIANDTTWFSASSPQAWPQVNEAVKPFMMENIQWSQSWDQTVKPTSKSMLVKPQKPSKIKKEGDSLDLSSELEQLSLSDSSDLIRKNKKQQQQISLEEALKQQQPAIEDELSKQNLYKTELCRSFTDTGSCRYGHKCQFAHGSHELRPVLRHPKYKTEICKTYSITAHCPYGNRCRFIHPKEISKPLDPLSLQSVQWSSSWNPQTGPQFATGSVFPFFNNTPAQPAEEAEDEQEDTAAKSRLAIFQELTTH